MFLFTFLKIKLAFVEIPDTKFTVISPFFYLLAKLTLLVKYSISMSSTEFLSAWKSAASLGIQ